VARAVSVRPNSTPAHAKLLIAFANIFVSFFRGASDFRKPTSS
jgi:hypothetical protein